MLYRSRPRKIYFYGQPVDFRKQISGLASIVDTEFQGELFQSSWFVFISRDRQKAKILYWRGTGFALWQLRLESDRFDLGSPRFLEKRTLSWLDLGRLLDGYNIFRGDPHRPIPPKRFS